MSRPPPWSKRTDQLVRYVAETTRPSFRSELARWATDRPRFAAFLDTNQDKVRKKLRGASNEEARLDVRAELHVAYLVLEDRRFELGFEAYGSGQPGPDLTVTYRANQRFNLEVTRLRGDAEAVKVGDVIVAKVRQLTADLPNLLVVTGRGLVATADDLAATLKRLKARVDGRDDDFYTRRGYRDTRDFFGRYQRLAGAFVRDAHVA